jgi:predicted aldo/keto reductase-like oxidoreductase
MLFNDLFCLSHPEVHTLSIGAARPSDFDEHLAVLPLLEDAATRLSPIVERLRGAMEAATGHSDPEAITSGIPSFEHCPERMNFQVMLWLYNLARGWDLLEYGKMRFNMLGNGGHWFPGGEPRELGEIPRQEILDAVRQSPFAEQIPELLRESVRLLGGKAVRRQSQSE